jgi:citrate synthase
MADAVIRFRDKEAHLDVIESVEGQVAADIGRLRKDLGLTTIDRGFANTAESVSAVSFVGGEEGVLHYRGYLIEELAEQATFLEVVYLLQYGELPTKAELEAYPHRAHPMQILASATSALATYYPDALDPHDEEAVDISARRLIAKTPTMIAWSYKYSVHQPYIYPQNDLDYLSNFLHLMFSVPAESYTADPAVARALNLLLVLHADHGQNCSTSAVRLVGSSQANLFSSVAAGIHALSGPLHGGANQEVLEMLEEIVAAGGDVAPFVARAKDKDDPFRLMGFGHRVYKNFDPRARIIKRAADEVLDALGIDDDPLLDVAMQLEEVALSDDYFVERKLYPNVDFYSGIIYRAIGFPTDMFTVLFALGRLPGWISQWRELLADPTTRIFRPTQIYIGPERRPYVPLEDRS